MEPTPDYYCVFAGWVPGIYTSFEEVQEQINDFPAWVLFFGDGDYDRGLSRINNGLAPEPVTLDHYREKQRIALRALHERFRREDQIPFLTTCEVTDDLAPRKPTNAHLLTFSMRKLLSDACDRLEPPSHHKNLSRWSHMLPPPRLTGPSPCQQPLVESGRIAFDVDTNIEDATRMTLRTLCASLEVVVDDYNYDIVQALTDKYANLANHFCNTG
ncbi:hypothetical protein AHAS_Ahas20G0162700 [Arachis hypogaea]